MWILVKQMSIDSQFTHQNYRIRESAGEEVEKTKEFFERGY